MDTLTATHGLEAAEAILNVVAHTLRNGLDPLDFLGRWSDDQFLAVVANCGNGDLLTTAERLKTARPILRDHLVGRSIIGHSVGGWNGLDSRGAPRPTSGPYRERASTGRCPGRQFRRRRALCTGNTVIKER